MTTKRMAEKQSVKFELFELEMVWNEESGWEENDRHRLGNVTVETDRSGEITDRQVIKAVAEKDISDAIGRKFPALTTTDRRRVYAEDLYGDGQWWEVGAVKRHEPIYGLKLMEEVVV